MKKGMVNALSLALTFINLVLTIVMVFVFVPAINKTSNLVDKICTIIDLNVADNADSDKVDVSDLENVVVTFGDSSENTISLKRSEGDSTPHYARVSVIISLNKTHADYATKAPAIEGSMGLIASSTIDVISAYSYEEVDKEKMEQELLRELQKLFDSEFVYSVSFNQFVLQ